MKIKICGLQTKQDVAAAILAGADLLGFVLAESKRQVSPETIRELTENCPEGIQKVGVFVSPDRETLQKTITAAGLDMVQIHGEVPAGKLEVPMIQAIPVHSQGMTTALKGDYLLFDAPPQRYVGGNGQTFDWTALDQQILKERKGFVAGGLTSENVQEAIALFQPYGVDVSSGVETDGKKDPEKMKQFVEKARGI